jgi:hypothetical protein
MLQSFGELCFLCGYGVIINGDLNYSIDNCNFRFEWTVLVKIFDGFYELVIIF